MISIIIPVYNVEKYLRTCLDSILAQTVSDWECVLVDDGSKDSSGAICDEYVLTDKRFKVFHTKNGGVSSARNLGIEKACGEWCCFVDSDDWIEVSYLQNYLDTLKKQDDLILQSFCKDDELLSKSTLVSLPEKLINSASELVFFLEYTNGVHNGYLWHRLFKLSIIKEFDIRFPLEVSFAEDGIFCLNYILHTKNFRLTNKMGYHHMVRPNTLTSTGRNLPLEKIFYLLEKYSSLVYQIVKKDNPSSIIVRGLRHLYSRWLINWLLVNIKTEEAYYKFLSNIPNVTWEKFCNMNSAMGKSIILSALFLNFSSPPSFFQFKVFQFLVILFKVDYWIKIRMIFNKNM